MGRHKSTNRFCKNNCGSVKQNDSPYCRSCHLEKMRLYSANYNLNRRTFLSFATKLTKPNKTVLLKEIEDMEKACYNLAKESKPYQRNLELEVKTTELIALTKDFYPKNTC